MRSVRQSFNPKRLDKLKHALERAWKVVEGRTPNPMREVTRELMASAIVRAAERGAARPRALKAAALAAFRRTPDKAPD
jgi:hypothetical protein